MTSGETTFEGFVSWRWTAGRFGVLGGVLPIPDAVLTISPDTVRVRATSPPSTWLRMGWTASLTSMESAEAIVLSREAKLTWATDFLRPSYCPYWTGIMLQSRGRKIQGIFLADDESTRSILDIFKANGIRVEHEPRRLGTIGSKHL